MTAQFESVGFMPNSREEVRQHTGMISEQDLIDAVYCLRFERKERYIFFDKSMFGEIAWDILLELYSYSCGSRLVPIGSLECAKGATTYISWLSLLKEDGLIHITGRGAISTRSRVNLTTRGRENVEKYVKGCLNRLVVDIN